MVVEAQRGDHAFIRSLRLISRGLLLFANAILSDYAQLNYLTAEVPVVSHVA